jgi:hypothetical protein
MKKAGPMPCDAAPCAVRTDRRIAFGSRSARRPAPSQAPRQVQGDRRAAADGVRLPSPFREIPPGGRFLGPAAKGRRPDFRGRARGRRAKGHRPPQAVRVVWTPAA